MKWITIQEFADKFGLDRTKIYHDIKWNRIPKGKWCKKEVKKVQYMIADDFKPRAVEK